MRKMGVFGACATLALVCTVVAAPASADMKLKIIAAPNMRPVLPELQPPTNATTARSYRYPMSPRHKSNHRSRPAQASTW